jgi:pimeloyl-ACP methyl ester carboxylesterase
MDHLKIEKAHIVGYSMGGFMTEELLMEHPNRFITATFGSAGWSDHKDTTQANTLNMLADSLEQGKGIGPLIVALNPVGAQPPTPQMLEATNKMFMATADTQALAGWLAGWLSLAHAVEPLPLVAALCRDSRVAATSRDHRERLIRAVMALISPPRCERYSRAHRRLTQSDPNSRRPA